MVPGLRIKHKHCLALSVALLACGEQTPRPARGDIEGIIPPGALVSQVLVSHVILRGSSHQGPLSLSLSSDVLTDVWNILIQKLSQSSQWEPLSLNMYEQIHRHYKYTDVDGNACTYDIGDTVLMLSFSSPYL